MSTAARNVSKTVRTDATLSTRRAWSGFLGLLIAALMLVLEMGSAVGQAPPVTKPIPQSAEKRSRLGVGFLVGRATEPLIPLLETDKDFLEMMLGPGKIRYLREVKPPARAMCICGSLEDIAKSIRLLQEAEIAPQRVYLAYNPEPRPATARQLTPAAELDDYPNSLRKARELANRYGAPLVFGPGLSEMARREHLYPELARHCDIWMIQTQRLQLDPQIGEFSSPERYREQVMRIVALLREGNPNIRVFVQIIPLQATAERKAFFTAERVTAYMLAVEDLVDAVKIYGGNAELITEVVERLRGGRIAREREPAEQSGRMREETRRREDGREQGMSPNGAAHVGEADAETSPPPGTRLSTPNHPQRAQLRNRREEPASSERRGDANGAAAAAEKQSVMLEMRDGARLATDWYLPAAAAGVDVPVVLIRTPYDKERPNQAMERWRDCLLRNGYAVAVQDMRGFYGSQASGRSGPAQFDGYDTIQWLAEQSWCNGKVGMMGFSHLGSAQYEAAVTGPPHLACAIPAQAPGNYFTDAIFPPTFRKADMETVLRGPFSARMTPLWNTRIRRHGESRIAQFNTPMMHCAGWYDFYKEGAIEMFRAVQTEGGERARGAQKLLIGPWGHGVLQEENLGEPLRLPGGLAYPASAKLDWEKEVWLPWFDHWLKGETTGVLDRPAVKYYLMGDVGNPQAPGNRWVEADDFPPKSVPVPYYVRSDRTLGTEMPVVAEDSLHYEYDPANPVPTVGRAHALRPVTGPYDQREVEQRPDVLVFTTPVLTAPLEIVGAVRARLWASSNRTDTDFTVKLTDVYPDGRSMIFLDGIVRGRYRNTYLKEEFLEPGQVYEFDVDLGYIAIAIAPGHRLRMAISSSNFDRWDINPNTGEPYGAHAVSQSLLVARFGADAPREEATYTKSLVAANTIFMDATHPTHITLPLLSAATNAADK